MSKQELTVVKDKEEKKIPKPMAVVQQEMSDLAEANLRDAVKYDEKGEILLDHNGKPLFKDKIQWTTEGAQILAILEVFKAMMENKMVPQAEEGAVFDTMNKLAAEYDKRKDPSKKFDIRIPVNYFNGIFHMLTLSYANGIFSEDLEMENSVKELAMWFEDQIRIYHEMKRRERVLEEASPEKVLKAPRTNNRFEEFREKAKALPFKK